jgi:hypothetical protein
LLRNDPEDRSSRLLDMMRYDIIYLLTAIGLTPGGSGTVHIYTQTIHRTTHLIWEECGPCLVFASYTLAFALQLRGGSPKSRGLCLRSVCGLKVEFLDVEPGGNGANIAQILADLLRIFSVHSYVEYTEGRPEH